MLHGVNKNPQGERVTPHDSLYREARPERGYLHLYERVLGFHSLKYIKGLGNLSFGSVKGPKRSNR